MEFDLTKYTIEEIVDIKNKCSNHIEYYSDGYDYICKVRSYGRNWTVNIYNVYSLQELCWEYFGEDGIVDVYSTNPDLPHIDNYGDVMYIVSRDAYNHWNDYDYIKHIIPTIEDSLDKWDNRDNVPFRERPLFEPIHTREDLEAMKKELVEDYLSVIEPRRYEK
jgi:hypothetical protein